MTTIDVSPEVATAYQAIQRIVAEHHLPVDVDDPSRLHRLPFNFEALIAASDPAYTVRLIVNLGMVTVNRTGRFGFVDQHTYVDYPVAHTASDFTERLADELLPVVRRELELAATEKASDFAQHSPDAAYEARDAVQRIETPEPAGRGRCADCGEMYASCGCYDEEDS